MCVCVYSNSRNDFSRVAQRYGTITAHTLRPASILVVSVVFCVHMHSFADLIRWTPRPTFSDTAITDRHSDTTIFQLRAHWVRISWSNGSEKLFGHVPPVGVEPRLPACKASTLSTRPGSPLILFYKQGSLLYIKIFVMDNLIGCIGNCLHPMKCHSGKFDLPIGCHLRVCKEQSEPTTLGL